MRDKFKHITIKRYANIDDTIKHIKRIAVISKDHPEVIRLSKKLRGNNLKNTCQNIWNWIRQNVTYQNDAPGKEQLRHAIVTIKQGIGDCDDMSILTSAILLNNGISHDFTITAYKRIGEWQHIYVVVNQSGQRYVIDCVPEIPHFNYEANPIVDLKSIPMKLEEIALGAIEDAALDVAEELTSGDDLDMNLEGLGSIDDEEELIEDLAEAEELLLGRFVLVDEEEAEQSIQPEEVKAFKKGLLLNQVRDALLHLRSDENKMNPIINSEKEVRLLKDIIESWNNDEAALEALNIAINSSVVYKNFYKALKAGLEDASGLKGLGIVADDDEAIHLAAVSDSLGRIKLRKLNLRKKLKKFKKKLRPKNVFKKVAQNLKKFSPTAASLRVTALALIRANTKQIATKLRVGYYSPSEAKMKGYSSAEHDRFVKAKNKAVKLWKKAGGSEKSFKKSIMAGAGRKNSEVRGIGQLGVWPAIIGAIVSLVEKLVVAIKDRKEKKAAEAAAAPAADSEYEETSAEVIDTTELDTYEEDTELQTPSGKKVKISTNKQGKKVATDPDTGVEVNPETGEPEGAKNKAMNFFKKNKVLVIVIAVVLTIGIIALVIWMRKKKADKKRTNRLRGLKGARTRKANALAGYESTKKSGSRTTVTYSNKKAAKKSGQLMGKKRTTKKRKVGDSAYMKKVTAKARAYRKKHPNAKWSTALSYGHKQTAA